MTEKNNRNKEEDLMKIFSITRKAKEQDEGFLMEEGKSMKKAFRRALK